MAQQINLCTPILLKPKQYFSAATMVLALAAFVVLGGGLCAVWVWNMQRATDTLRVTVKGQTSEMEKLKEAIASSRAAAAPVDPVLQQQLEATRNALQSRQSLRDALRQGMLVPGWGHSDRLMWVARSIPAPVWVRDIKMDHDRFEVTGYTLEPAALNGWVEKLATNPLMQGMKLATVKVESAQVAQLGLVNASGAAVAAGNPSAVSGTPAPASSQRPVWSFNLYSAVPATAPAKPVGAAAAKVVNAANAVNVVNAAQPVGGKP